MLGNNAIVEGALVAGCNLFGGYPITPANEISERMPQRCLRSGASIADAKAITATASAGFNYMQEGIMYASAVKGPMVIVDMQMISGNYYSRLRRCRKQKCYRRI